MAIDFPHWILARIPDLIAYKDPDLAYRYTNEAYQRALGRSAEELEKKSVFEVLPERTLEIALPRMRAALAGEEVEFDSQLRLPGSPRRWLHARYIPDRAEDGTVLGFFAVLTDVTARTEAEKELNRVKELCDDLPALLAHCDAEERYLYVNRAYAETYGRTKDAIIGKRVQDVVPAELYTAIGPHIASLLAGGSVDFDAHVPRADGVRTWMAVRGIPEFSGAEVVGFFVNVSDISKHKELETLRSEFAVGIVRAQEAERKALARELHDGIAQELAGLAVFSNVLEREGGSGAQESVGSRIHAGLRRTVAEIRRLSYGLHPLELSERGLVGAVQEFLERTRQAHARMDIDLERAGIPDEVSLGADADIAVYRIVQEAVANALRHADATEIRVRMRLADGGVEGTVSDDGKGFEPERKSVGLGLPSMRERAALLDGSLTIASGQEGTVVGFSIPGESSP